MGDAEPFLRPWPHDGVAQTDTRLPDMCYRCWTVQYRQTTIHVFTHLIDAYSHDLFFERLQICSGSWAEEYICDAHALLGPHAAHWDVVYAQCSS